MIARPSRTALLVAKSRAAHQLYDERPLVLDDPFALPILGAEAEAELKASARKLARAFPKAFRAIIVVRSRFAEDELARARARGVRQYVVLGAGLDTSAYRAGASGDGLRIFEVDHPATQAWKRAQVTQAGITVPDNLTYVPVDLEKDTLAHALAQAGFDRNAPAFFSWLGVVYYLTGPAIASTLGYIGSLPAGSGVVFDHHVPRATLPWVQRLVHAHVARKVARVGEPFLAAFTPAEMNALLREHGFHHIQDLDREAMNARYFAQRKDLVRVGGMSIRLISAEV